jgi:hypothetical protein
MRHEHDVAHPELGAPLRVYVLPRPAEPGFPRAGR